MLGKILVNVPSSGLLGILKIFFCYWEEKNENMGSWSPALQLILITKIKSSINVILIPQKLKGHLKKLARVEARAGAGQEQGDGVVVA